MGLPKGNIPWNKGVKNCFSEKTIKQMSASKLGASRASHSEETKRKMSLAKKGKPFTKKHRKALSLAKKGKPKILSEESKRSFRKKMSGENNWRWLSDRTKLKKDEKKHLDGRYREWMKAVKNRDGWQCRIANGDCSGRLEAHHILPWRSHPEVRYQINNGITLCHAHHPRGEAQEKRLISEFQRLVTVSSE